MSDLLREADLRRLAMLLAFVGCGSAGHAQVASNAIQSGQNTAITVKGRSGPAVRDYVEKIAKPDLGRQIARWNGPICIAIDGISDKFSNFIRVRVTEVAQSLRLKVLAPGCPVNVTIKMTDRADELTTALIQARPKRVGNINSGALLPRDLVTALEAPRPVRWMTASETVSADGMPLGRTDSLRTNYSSGSDPKPIPTINMVYDSSVIRSYVRENEVAKIIVIDESRLKNVTLLQLADYIAFLTVSTPDISADYSNVDSIMALFSDPASSDKPNGMTSSDRVFLHALYDSKADRTADQQRGAIRQQILSYRRRDQIDTAVGDPRHSP